MIKENRMPIFTIYKCVNNINNKCYIGYSSNFEKRKKKHKVKYNDSKDQLYNTKFYRAIRKYGWENFEWCIVYQSKEYEHTLSIMENYFIEEYDSYNNGYNMTLGGEGAFGANTRTFEFISPNKETVSVTHLRGFCVENCLDYQCMLDVANLRQLSHKGYNNINHKDFVSNRETEYSFISPDGDIFVTKQLKTFCKEHNLIDTNMYLVHKGKRLSHKGWIKL